MASRTPRLVLHNLYLAPVSPGSGFGPRQPFLDPMLPEGHRLHVVLEGITRGFTAVNMRKFDEHYALPEWSLGNKLLQLLARA